MTPQQHILLVEDDDIDAMTVKRTLKELGAPNPLDRAIDGERALAFLRNPANARPGLILLDLNMPRMNGLEFLRELRADPELRPLTVVVLTTSDDDRDKVEAYQFNVAGYILKPVTFPAFVEAMATLNKYWSISEIV
jgi:CheY-like chemotaxis protein